HWPSWATVLATVVGLILGGDTMGLFRGFKLIAELRWKRDERLWADFESVRAHAATRGAHIADVETIRQRARTGTKAYVRWLDTGEVDAVWARARRLSK